MTSKFIIDSMLPKYHQQFQHNNLFNSAISTENSGLAVNYSTTSSPSSSSPSSTSSQSPSAKMYPYVSAAHHHSQQQAVAAFNAAAAGSMVPGFSTSASTAALAAAVDAATDKSCRYTAGLTGGVPPAPDSMVNYTLGHHHQNGAAASAVSAAASSVSAASASMAVAAQFYHQAASAVVDPALSCSQPGAGTAGQPIPDIPRYPWMSITGKSNPLFLYIILQETTIKFRQ